jgi:hypothetical protein
MRRNLITILFIISFSFFLILPLLLKAYSDGEDPSAMINLLEDYSLEINIVLVSISSLLLGRFVYHPTLKLPRLTVEFTPKSSVLFSLVIITSIPSLCFAFVFFQQYGGSNLYGEGQIPPLPAIYQVFFYLNLTLYFILLSYKNCYTSKAQLYAFTAVAIPRIIVTLSYGRWFLAQLLVPVALLYILSSVSGKARSRGVLSKKQLTTLISLLLIFSFVFLIGLVREGGLNQISLLTYFIMGGTFDVLKLHSQYVGEPTINYLYSSIILKNLPFLADKAHVISVWGRDNMIATMDRVMTSYMLGDKVDLFFGTASSYIFELYLSAGYFGIILGNFVLGRLLRWLDSRALTTSIGTFIFLDLTPKVLLLPRSNFGYLTERFLLVCLIYVFIHLLIHKRPYLLT